MHRKILEIESVGLEGVFQSPVRGFELDGKRLDYAVFEINAILTARCSPLPEILLISCRYLPITIGSITSEGNGYLQPAVFHPPLEDF